MARGPGAQASGSSLFTFVIVILALVALYYLYRFLYSSAGIDMTMLVPGKHAGDSPPDKLPKMPTPYEGGEYTFTTWLYISSFNKNMNARKHIFEIKGRNFSSLVVGLGAFKNTLVVRTHYKDLVSTESFQGAVIPAVARSTEEEGFQSTSPPNASSAANEGKLPANGMGAFFAPMTTEDSIMTTPPMCDLPEIDLQRWVMVTVVLSGRTIDVYLDGKLARSCITSSYYKVDPTGVEPKVCDRGGFDGYISNMATANYAMNPDEIYRTYLSGPQGANYNIVSWALSLFQGGSA